MDVRISEQFPQSARQARREETWPLFQEEMRACKTLKDLDATWGRWHSVIRAYPPRWRDCAVQLHEECKADLGGTLAALQDSLVLLDEPPGRIYEAWLEDKRRW